jgi:hypothetical protein
LNVGSAGALIDMPYRVDDHFEAATWEILTRLVEIVEVSCSQSLESIYIKKTRFYTRNKIRIDKRTCRPGKALKELAGTIKFV